MDADGIMALSSKQYEMYGSHRGNFERVELSNQTTRDSILDGIQIGLGIISAIGTCIPGIGWGVALAANSLDALISVGRGDMIGAGMAMFGVFGDMFGWLADAGKAANALSDTAQSAPAHFESSGKHRGIVWSGLNWCHGGCFPYIRSRAYFQNQSRGLDRRK